MAIVGSELTTGSESSPTGSDDTASISPTGDALVLIDVHGAQGGGVAPPVPTISGNGLTWVQVDTVTFTDGATETHRLTRFRAMGSSPSTGAVTIEHSEAPNSHLNWTVREYTGVVTTGDDGADTVVQTDTNTGSSDSPSVTLAAFDDAGNGADACVGPMGGPDVTPEEDWTGYTTAPSGMSTRAQWRDDPDTTPSATLSASDDWGMIATEIAADADGGETVSPGAGSLVYTGQAPTVLTGGDVDVSVPASTLAYQGQAPAVRETVPVAAASLVYTGQAPTVRDLPAAPSGYDADATASDEITYSWTAPDDASLTVRIYERVEGSGDPFALVAEVPSDESPHVGVGRSSGTTYESYATTWDGSNESLQTDTETTTTAFPVSSGSLVYQGQAPSVSDSDTLTPAAASLVYQGQAPTVTETVPVPAGTLRYQGQTPTVDDSDTVRPGAGSLVYQGQAPTVLVGEAISVAVPAQSLVFTGATPTVIETVKVPSVSLALRGAAPKIPQTIKIAAGGLVYTGQVPTITGDTVVLELPFTAEWANPAREAAWKDPARKTEWTGGGS